MKNIVAIIIGGFLLTSLGDAKELVLVCPDEIPAAIIRNVEVKPGWRIFNPNKLKLHSASFAGGQPEEMIELVPTQVSKRKGATSEHWKFDGDEIWLRCAYGAAGQITLSRKVEGRQTECSVTYERESPSRIICVDG